MHDPLIAIRDFSLPVYNRRAKIWEYIAFATLWHKDPETDGTDDSCGWSSPKLTKEEKQWAAQLIEHPHDNITFLFGDARTGIGRDGAPYIEYVDERDMIQVCSIAMRTYKRKTRPWYQHARWHVHHWHISFSLRVAWRDWWRIAQLPKKS